jgi:hypothetical protein
MQLYRLSFFVPYVGAVFVLLTAYAFLNKFSNLILYV